MRTKPANFILVAAFLLLSATVAGALTITGSSSTTAYSVSASDLLQTSGLSSVSDALTANVPENNAWSHGTTASLTDGTFGPAGATNGYCIASGTVTYLLDTNLNPGGYTITNLTTYSGWDNSGRANQNYTVSFRRVGSSTFVNPTVVSYAVTVSPPSGTQVTLNGFTETNVAAIRFDFSTPAQQNGGVGYKELDVFGYGAVPVWVPPTVSGSSSTSAYMVSASDLLQTTGLISMFDALTANVTENTANSHGTTASLTDGTFGSAGMSNGYCIASGTVTYLLNTDLNPDGYTITNITTYSGWANPARAQQNYTVSFRRIGASIFEHPAVVTYSYSGGNPANTKVNLTGFAEANVAAVRFDFSTPAQQSGGVGYKELDVFGYGAVPVGAVTNNTSPFPPAMVFTNIQDYGFMWWSNGLAASHYAIKTSRYGLLFNAVTLTPTALFPLSNPSPEAAVLIESQAASFPPSPLVTFSCQVVTNSVTNGITSFTGSSSDAQLVECGKFFQRRWHKVKAGGLLLNTNTSGLEVAAWPDRLSFVLRLVPSNMIPNATLQMTLSLTNKYNTLLTSGAGQALAAADGSGFVFFKSVGSATISINTNNATITVSTTMSNWLTNQEGSVGLIMYPATNVAAVLAAAVATETVTLLSATSIVPSGSGLAVSYDADRGWYDVSLPASGTGGDDGILRVQVVVANYSSSRRVVRLNFDGVPFYIPGLTAVLRDGYQNPLGIPVQLSKNWHNSGAGDPRKFVGQWFHGLTMLTVPANTNISFELAMVGQNWGGVPAATHSQLSLIGWFDIYGYSQWDEAALGGGGESLCYNIDHGANDSDGTDSRPMLTLGTNGLPSGFGINVGGAHFFRYYDSGGVERRHSRMRSQFVRYCPNLSEVVYAGQSDNGAVDFNYSCGLQRSDDYTRGLHRLRMNVNSNLTFSRFVFYQQAADTYNYNNGVTRACGDATNGLLRQWTATFGGNTNVGTPVALTGPMPWLMTLDSPGQAGYTPANHGFVIRSWKSRINGISNVPPYVVERAVTHDGSGASLFDIVPPPGVMNLQAGDFLEAEIVRFYVPKYASNYYGPNASFRQALTNYQNNYQLALRESRGNNLSVAVQAGSLAQTYPTIKVEVTNDFAQFSVTGGLDSYVPVTFTGISTYQNPVIEELVGNSWAAINQAVNGNDFWQTDYNSATRTWELTYNLRFGSTNYQDVAALLTNAATRAFRFSNPNTVSIIPSVPIIFTNTVWLAGSGGAGANGFQFSGTGPAGQAWRLLTTTNLALPWGQWILETSNTFSGSGQFNYTSSVPPNVRQKFYRLISP